MTDSSKHRQLAVAIVRDISPKDLVAVQAWAEGLIAIKEGNQSRLNKARAAIALTLVSKIVWPAVKSAAATTKKIGWDDRSSTARLGLAGAGVGLALFGGQSAGIAALGTAIGLPLWIVLGAGSAFAGVFVEEIRRARASTTDQSNPSQNPMD